MIKKQKKLKFIQTHLESEKDFLALINGPRANKVNFVLKLSSVLPNLMYGLFNLEPKLKQNGI